MTLKWNIYSKLPTSKRNPAHSVPNNALKYYLNRLYNYSPRNFISITSKEREEHNLSVIPHNNNHFEVDTTFPTIDEKSDSIESPYLPPVRW